MPQTAAQKAEYDKAYREKHKESIAAKKKKYCEGNKEDIAAKKKEYYENNREALIAKSKEYSDAATVSSRASIAAGAIVDGVQWHRFCQKKRKGARKWPYSADFTDDMMFEKLILGCFYCGGPASVLDRIDSKKDHEPDNCVGSCEGCNISKSDGCIETFLDRAYYRVIGTYYFHEDGDCWSDNKKRPAYGGYKWDADDRGIPFELTKDQFYGLVELECAYCHRTPEWVGVDRVVPVKGYVLDNVAPCCDSCNRDKYTDTPEVTKARNAAIAERVGTGIFDEIVCEKVISGRGDTGKMKTCSGGKLYPSAREASFALGKYKNYVSSCISAGRYLDTFFYVSDAFYKKYVETDGITRSMYDAFEYYYASS